MASLVITAPLYLSVQLRFHFYEKYEGAAGFEAHQATAHFAAWEAFASSEPSPFTEPPRVEFYEEFF